MLRLLGNSVDLYKSTDSLSGIALKCLRHATVTLSYAPKVFCSPTYESPCSDDCLLDFAVPDWLQSCLNAPPSDSEPVQIAHLLMPP